MKALAYQLKATKKLNILLGLIYIGYILLTRWMSSAPLDFLWNILPMLQRVLGVIAPFVVLSYVLYNTYSVLVTIFSNDETIIAAGARSRAEVVLAKIITAVIYYLPVSLVITYMSYWALMQNARLAGSKLIFYSIAMNGIGSVLMILTYLLVPTGVMAVIKRRTANWESGLAGLLVSLYLTFVYVQKLINDISLFKLISLDKSTPALARASSLTPILLYIIPCLAFGALAVAGLRESRD